MLSLIRTHLSLSVQATLAMLIAVALWGSSFVALKVAVTAFSPLVMVFGRMACSLMALGIILLIRGRKSGSFAFSRSGITRRDWFFIVLLALCEPCFYFVFEGYAIQYTTASQAGMIVAALPLAVVGIGWVFFGERPGKMVWLGILLGLIGVIGLSWGAEVSAAAPDPVLGNILEVFAMICAALYVICAKQVQPSCSPLLITGMQSLVGFLFFLPLQALPNVVWPETLPLIPTLAVVYLGVIVTLISFLMYNFALRHAPASRVGAYLNLTPVFSLTFGVLLLGETLTPGQWAASALVLGGVVLSQKNTSGETV